jgi:hypothetical protein
MSNNAYAVKRKALLDSNLLLNTYFDPVERWDVESIGRRGRELASLVASLWPNPRQPEAGVEPELESKAGRTSGDRSNFDIEQLRTQSLARLVQVVGMELVQKGDARYVSEDGRARILCLASQPYPDRHGEGYWFGVSPTQLEFLNDASVAHVALCCGTPDRILWIPRNDLSGFVENTNRTPARHWHIQVVAGDAIRLDQPRKQTKVDVTHYLLAARRSS